MSLNEEIGQISNKKILIIYSTPANWTEEEILDSQMMVEEMGKGLKSLGLNVEWRRIELDIEGVMQEFDPKETLVMNWCEGYGDDGYDDWTITGKLDQMGFIYTGGSPDCLRLTMDKMGSKKVLASRRVRIPRSKLYLDGKIDNWKGFPALVKPAREHSSCGIDSGSVVDNLKQLVERVEWTRKEFGPAVLVEEFIEGREFNVALWGNGKEVEVLPIGMIDFSSFDDYHQRLVGFAAKWDYESEEWKKTQVSCPAPISKSLQKKLETIAIKAYMATGCRDYARVDIRVRDETPYVLEVNSNPDITTAGGFMRSAGKAGWSFPEAVAKILAFALKRGGDVLDLNYEGKTLVAPSNLRGEFAGFNLGSIAVE